MRTCTLCHADNVETVPLWNGEHYCAQCLDKEHEGLCDYARSHTTLTSNYRQFFDWAFFRYYFTYWNIVIIVVSCVFLGAVFSSVDPPISLSEFILWSVVMGTMMSLMTLVQPYSDFLQEIQKHPRIKIGNETITLSLRITVFWIPVKTKTLSLPLSAVNLRVLPLCNDNYLPWISRVNEKQYALLDFSSCIEESFLNVVHQVYFPLKLAGIEKKRWSASPYLCFSASPVKNDILEAFFRIAALETDKRTEPQS